MTDSDEALARHLAEQEAFDVARIDSRILMGAGQRGQPRSSAPYTGGDSALARRLAAEDAGHQRSSASQPPPWAEQLANGRGGMSQQEEQPQDSPHVACEIASGAVEMLVDTGAQMSVMSSPLMRQLGLAGHLDRSYQGVAAGVGQARIVGKLRGVPVKMGHVEFQLSFSVLEAETPILILGIDQMRRFKCVIDLERDCLVFGGSGGVEVPFLKDPPRQMRGRNGDCSAM